MNTLPATIALALIALTAIIAGAVVSASGTADASALWALAGTAAGAIGGAMIPRNAPLP
jgi:hypothetical protein